MDSSDEDSETVIEEKKWPPQEWEQLGCPVEQVLEEEINELEEEVLRCSEINKIGR